MAMHSNQKDIMESIVFSPISMGQIVDIENIIIQNKLSGIERSKMANVSISMVPHVIHNISIKEKQAQRLSQVAIGQKASQSEIILKDTDQILTDTNTVHMTRLTQMVGVFSQKDLNKFMEILHKASSDERKPVSEISGNVHRSLNQIPLEELMRNVTFISKTNYDGRTIPSSHMEEALFKTVRFSPKKEEQEQMVDVEDGIESLDDFLEDVPVQNVSIGLSSCIFRNVESCTLYSIYPTDQDQKLGNYSFQQVQHLQQRAASFITNSSIEELTSSEPETLDDLMSEPKIESIESLDLSSSEVISAYPYTKDKFIVGPVDKILNTAILIQASNLTIKDDIVYTMQGEEKGFTKTMRPAMGHQGFSSISMFTLITWITGILALITFFVLQVIK